MLWQCYFSGSVNHFDFARKKVEKISGVALGTFKNNHLPFAVGVASNTNPLIETFSAISNFVTSIFSSKKLGLQKDYLLKQKGDDFNDQKK